MLNWILATVAVLSVASMFWENRKKMPFVWVIWRCFRFRMVLETIVLIAVVITTFAALLAISNDFFGWGWLGMLTGTSGNANITPIIQGSKSGHLLTRLLVPVFLVAFIISMPFLTRWEEKTFRRRCWNWKNVLIQAPKFGFVHMLVGVPIGGAIALSIGGLFFGYKYMKAFKRAAQKNSDSKLNTLQQGRKAAHEALLTSTTYHTLYNTLLCSLMLAVTISRI